MLLKSGVYAILNIQNEKLYIGSSIYIKDRWNVHRKQLRLNKHHSKYLQRAWNKYGEQNFIFTVIEYCMRDYLTEREQHWMDDLKSTYNTYPTAGSPLGCKRSEETKAKMRLRQISKEHRQIVSNANKNRVGVKYNVKSEHTWRNCKCEHCLLLKAEYRRNWKAKKKAQNPELYVEQQRKWDAKKNKYKSFIIVNDASLD